MIGGLIRSFLMYSDVFGTMNALRALHAARFRASGCFPIAPKYGAPGVKLRVPSSDIMAFREVFCRREYEAEFLSSPCAIVDAGANVGLTSVFLAKCFPNARIIAIEPQYDNYQQLVRNTDGFSNVRCLNAAVWSENTRLLLDDRGTGAWGFGVRPLQSSSEPSPGYDCSVEAVTIVDVMQRFQLSRIDFLKMDIEGAEREVLQRSHVWMPHVDVMAVELHETICPGATRAFYNATNGFEAESERGETKWVARTGKLLRMPKN